MKLVDIFLAKRRGVATIEDLSALFEDGVKQRYEVVLEKTLHQQRNRETALKLQSLQKYMFGKVSRVRMHDND